MKILVKSMEMTLFAALLAASPAHAFRCGPKIIEPGMLAIDVRDKCGDPVSEEVIGYALASAPPGVRGEREFKIEQWIYGPDQGYYHVLIFEAGRLRDIDKSKE